MEKAGEHGALVLCFNCSSSFLMLEGLRARYSTARLQSLLKLAEAPATREEGAFHTRVRLRDSVDNKLPLMLMASIRMDPPV